MKRNLHIIPIICAMVTCIQVNSQNIIIYGDKAFGTIFNESLPIIQSINDHQLLISGMSQGDVNGDKTDSLCDTLPGVQSDIWILKIDTAFNIITDNSIGGDQVESRPSEFLYIGNGMHLFNCISQSNISCDKTNNNWLLEEDMWLFIMDSSNTILWDKNYGGLLSLEDYPQMTLLSNGNLVLCGLSANGPGGDKSCTNFGSWDYWCLYLDSLGNKIWNNCYGGNGIERDQYDIVSDSIYFVIGGSTMSGISGSISDSSRGLSDIWIIQIDSLGNKVWDKRYGGIGGDELNHIIKIDTGFLLCGMTESPQGLDISQPSLGNGDVFIIKTDTAGNKIWDKRYGGIGYDNGRWARQTSDGGFIIAATTYSDSSFHISEPSYGGADYWIFKIDSMGNLLWEKRFGGPGNDFVKNFEIMSDSSIYIIGQADTGTSAVKTDFGDGKVDYWLIRVKVDESTSIHQIPDYPVNIFPNPITVGQTIKIELGNANYGIDGIEIFSVEGKLIEKIVEFDQRNTFIRIGSSFKPGIYFITLKSRTYYVTKKLVILGE